MAIKLKTRGLVRILAALGVASFAVGVATTAEEQRTTADQSEIDALVGQLKAESFSERQKAVARLVEIGRPALAALEKAAAAGEPQVRLLANQIREAVGIHGKPVDLTGFANHPRDQKFGSLADNNLASLKGGLACVAITAVGTDDAGGVEEATGEKPGANTGEVAE